MTKDTVSSSDGMLSLSFDDGWVSHYDNALPILDNAGIDGTFYINTVPIIEGWEGYLTPEQVQALSASGHEIGSHSRTHAQLPGLSESELNNEVAFSREEFELLGIGQPSTFAYPYGEFDEQVKDAVAGSGFSAARGVEAGYNEFGTDPYALRVQEVDAGTSLDTAKNWIDEAAARDSWLILMFHQLDYSGAAYGTTPDVLQGITDYINEGGIQTTTIADGVSILNSESELNKEVASQIIGTNEYSEKNWRAHYKEIEDIGDGRGYTAGIVGFTSGTGDMLDLVNYYTSIKPDNILARYIPALEALNGTDSHKGLDPTFKADWDTAAADPLFQQAQDHERDSVYFVPAVSQGKSDGLGALGQLIYYDAYVMHGESGFDSIRATAMEATAMENAETPAQGGDEATYLHAFLDANRDVMENDSTWGDNLDRIDTEQRVWVDQGNLDLDTPLSWTVNGHDWDIV
ncbi:MAG: chitosanase [Nitrospira sp.]